MTVQLLFMMGSFAACHVADQKSVIHAVTLLRYLVLLHGMTFLIRKLIAWVFANSDFMYTCGLPSLRGPGIGIVCVALKKRSSRYEVTGKLVSLG